MTEAKAPGVPPGDGHLLDEVDVVQEELDAQEEIEGHVRLLLPGVVLPSLGSHFGEFGIGVDEEKLIVCKFLFFFLQIVGEMQKKGGRSATRNNGPSK